MELALCTGALGLLVPVSGNFKATTKRHDTIPCKSWEIQQLQVTWPDVYEFKSQLWQNTSGEPWSMIIKMAFHVTGKDTAAEPINTRRKILNAGFPVLTKSVWCEVKPSL